MKKHEKDNLKTVILDFDKISRVRSRLHTMFIHIQHIITNLHTSYYTLASSYYDTNQHKRPGSVKKKAN